MKFISVQQAAVDFGVSVRTVQKWAKEGKIKGAQRVGSTWIIPCDAECLCKSECKQINNEDQNKTVSVPLYLINQSFKPGSAFELVEKIENPKDKLFAMAEYYYLRGEEDEAAEMFEKFIADNDDSVSFTAGMLFSFSNLSINKPRIAQMALSDFKKYMLNTVKSTPASKENAVCYFIATAAGVLMHSDKADTSQMEKIVKFFPEGTRLFCAYVMAHFAYLQKDYSRALGIAEATLAVGSDSYPVTTIYLKLISAVALMHLKQVNEAKRLFIDAWKIAEPDGFIEPIIEHHGLLLGLVEVCIKDTNPTEYRRIVSGSAKFMNGWCKVHNNADENNVTNELNTTEFIIAMMFDRGWTMKEISAFLKISLRMVKYHIATIYEKLCITKREELKNFMLK